MRERCQAPFPFSNKQSFEANKMHDFVKQFQKTLRAIEQKRERGEFTAALQQVDDLLQQETLSWLPTLLILRSVLIQQGDGSQRKNWTLQSAEENLRSAEVLDPLSPDPKIELGWLLHAVCNQPKAALPHFQQAIRRSWEFLHSAMVGRADCINDLHGPQAALTALEEAEKLFPQSARVKDLKTHYTKALQYKTRQQLKRGVTRKRR